MSTAECEPVPRRGERLSDFYKRKAEERFGVVHQQPGVWWYNAPIPHRWHRCKPWTTGNVNYLVERCACGAVRFDGSRFWLDRNNRRR